MSAFFKALAALFALVPGVTVLQSGLGTPPNEEKLFGGVIEVAGALTLALLWLYRDRLTQWSRGRATRWAIGLAVACVALVVGYRVMFTTCVITHEAYPGQTFYYPLWLSGRVARMAAMAGGRYEAIARYGPADVQSALGALTTARSLTSALLLLSYQAVFTTLTAAFGILGFHSGKELP
jgi:hypothetical protein